MPYSQETNKIKYKKIADGKRANPEVSLAHLCQQEGVSYHSYNNWVKKHIKSSDAPGHKLRATVQLSVKELANLIYENLKVYPIKVSDIVRQLNDEDKKTLAVELGSRRMRDFTDVDGGMIGKESEEWKEGHA